VPVAAPPGGWGSSVANLADLVRRAATTSGGRTALAAGSESWTWTDLDAAVSRIAGGLVALGLRPGDRVVLLLGNTPAFPLSYFATLRAGLVAVPVNTGLTAPEISHIVGDVGASLVLARGIDHDLLAEVCEAVPTLGRVVLTGTPEWELLLGCAPLTGPARSAAEDLAVIVYTSGTSGEPRGAMLSHRALVANLEQCAALPDVEVVLPGDVVLAVLPLFHIYGLNTALGQVAFHGATAVLAERFDPVESLALIRTHGVTVVAGAPPMYVAWAMMPGIAEAFGSVRLAISGAAPLPGPVLARMAEVTGTQVFEGYGLTETSPVLTTTLVGARPKEDSIGRPIPGVQLRLVLSDGGDLDPGEDDEPGEIVVRGPNLFSGYWPDGQDGPDEQGWWSTGDVAYVDDDGDLHLVDRRKDLILVSGFNVYPREVERVIANHPEVAEVAVIGIPHPYTGQSVRALVVLTPGSRLTAAQLIAFAGLSLAKFKCPTTVDVVTSLPHSATGKVSKGRLREGR
jgi:long-chain acyl-CoA synthetase